MIGLLLVGQTPIFSQKIIPIAFDVQLCDRNTAAIQWTRPGEDSFDYVLEKSADGMSWEMIASINSQPLPYYDYIDLHTTTGISYYRITQRRHDELVAVSDTKWIKVINGTKVSNAHKLYIWPTPANDILHVRSPFVNGNLDVIDSDGRFVRKITMIDFITNVPVQALPGGMYFIRVRHGKDILVEKFIKQQGY